MTNMFYYNIVTIYGFRYWKLKNVFFRCFIDFGSQVTFRGSRTNIVHAQLHSFGLIQCLSITFHHWLLHSTYSLTFDVKTLDTPQ